MKKNRVVTFYSYKGGVGRSLALVNTGFQLAQEGERVLLIDFDFEAPGLHEMEGLRRLSNRETLQQTRGKSKHGISFAPRESVGGAIGLMNLYRDAFVQNPNDPEQYPDWRLEDYAVLAENVAAESDETGGKGQVWLLPSGPVYQLETYREQLVDFDPTLTVEGQERALDAWSHVLARFWNMGFTWVLIDSRTGLSDPFYQALDVCDTVVLLGSYTRQNVKGLRMAWEMLADARNDPEKGERKVLLVGTPNPEIDPRDKKLWESRVATEDWPDFPGYEVELPYSAELAMEETVFALPKYQADTRFAVRTYREGIDQLASSLKTAWDRKTPFANPLPLKPSNPFELLRSDYISMEQLQQYFIDPGERIHHSLQEFMPVVVTGARGTGKTMLARYFGYERRIAELGLGAAPTPKDAEPYIGIYLRLDVDILNAFFTSDKGKQDTYDKLFGQFFDILVMRKALNALKDFGGVNQWCDEQALYRDLLREFDCPLQEKCSHSHLLRYLDDQLSEIRRYLRNPSKKEVPFLIQGNILLKILTDYLQVSPESEFNHHFFSIIVDEFEHFADFQQKVVNTRIKQIQQSDRVTYRIFLRHGGLKTTETLSGGQLIQPIHDFKYLHLDEERDFNEISSHFRNVANKYLEKNTYFSEIGRQDISQLFAQISNEEETRLIAGDRNDKPLLDWAIKQFPQDKAAIKSWFEQETRLHIKTLAVVMMNQGRGRRNSDKTPLKVIHEFSSDSKLAKDWLGNYGVGSLYWLCTLYRKQKLYAGLNTILLLSGNNIRTFLELCRSIIEEWLLSQNIEGEALDLPIPVKIQAKSLAKSAENYRSLLRSLSCYSRELLNLADRLGRLFEALNKTPNQSEPEINHFGLAPDTIYSPEAIEWDKWLKYAYSESVILRQTANKQKGDSDLRDDDWQLNPCYAPYYQFSPRRKKKLGRLSSQDLKILFSGTEVEFKAWFNNKTKKYTENTDTKNGNMNLFDSHVD